MAQSISVAYDLPDVKILCMDPDFEILSHLQYMCHLDGYTCSSAALLQEHIESDGHKQNLQQAEMIEDPEILKRLVWFAELEKPHREMHQPTTPVPRYAEYSLPDVNLLYRPSDCEPLSSPPYICHIDGWTSTSAACFQKHLMSREHLSYIEAAGVTEDPDISNQIAWYNELEMPHCEQEHLSYIEAAGVTEDPDTSNQIVWSNELEMPHCEHRNQKAADIMERHAKHEREGHANRMHELNAAAPVAKRRRQESTNAPITCDVCKVALFSSQAVLDHWRSPSHRELSKQFNCDLCRVACGSPAELGQHRSGKKTYGSH